MVPRLQIAAHVSVIAPNLIVESGSESRQQLKQPHLISDGAKKVVDFGFRNIGGKQAYIWYYDQLWST